jgi:hypothetical protein
MRYRTFLFWNALGGLCWGTVFTFAGYLAGKSYERVISAAGTASLSIIVLVASAIAGFVIWRKVRKNGARRSLRGTVGEVGSASVEVPRRERAVVAPLAAARWRPPLSTAREMSQSGRSAAFEASPTPCCREDCRR